MSFQRRADGAEVSGGALDLASTLAALLVRGFLAGGGRGGADESLSQDDDGMLGTGWRGPGVILGTAHRRW